MANKWMRKLGMGMSVLMTATQLYGMVVVAAPENDFNSEPDFGDMLEEKFEEEREEAEAGEDGGAWEEIATDDFDVEEETLVMAIDDENIFDNSNFKNCDSMSLSDVKTFYYDQLNTFEKDMYIKMMEFDMESHSIILFKENYSLYTPEEVSFALSKAYTALISDHPEYHMFLARYGHFEETDEHYTFTVERNAVIEYAYKRSVAKIDQLKRTFSGDKDRYIKLMQLWDYMGKNSEYDPYYPFGSDKKLDYNDCAAGIFYNNTAVCAGYAEAIKILCNEIDIPCILVGNKGHAWNFIEMENGKWYSVDFTGCWVDDEQGINNAESELLLGRYSTSITGTYVGDEPLYLMSKLYLASPDHEFYFPCIQDEQYSYNTAEIDYSYQMAEFLLEDEQISFTYAINDDHDTCVITGFEGTQKGDLVIPEKIDGYKVTEIGAEAFMSAKGFTGKLVLPETLLYIDDYAFQNCTGLSGALELPENLIKIGECAFQGDTGFSGDLIIPESVREIHKYAFYRCEGFDGDLKLPANLESLESAFPYTGFQGTLYFPDNMEWDAELVSGAGFTSFHINESNENLCIKDSIIYSKNMTILLACPAGKTGEIIIPDSVEEIGGYAFYRCQKVKGDINLPDSIVRIGDYAFSGASFNGAVHFPASLQELGDSTFSGSQITGDLVFPDKLKEIPDWTFFGCSSLNGTVTFGKSLEKVGEYAFFGTKVCGKIVFPDGIKFVGTHAFTVCNSISSFTFPEGIEYIGDDALDGYVKTVYFKGSKEQWENIIQNQTNVVSQEAVIHFGEVRAIEMNVKEMPITECVVGTDFVIDGHLVELIFSDNTSAYIELGLGETQSNGIRIDIPDMNTTGKKEVVLHYEDLQASYEISVIDAGPAPSPTSNESHATGELVLNEETGIFEYIVDGKKDNYTYAFIDYKGYKFIIANGGVAPINGLVMDPNSDKWYFCAQGQVVKYIGLVMYDNAWFYIEDGILNTELNALVHYDGGLFYVAAGRILKEVSGLAKDPNGTDWYFLAEGQAQTQYTGLAMYDGEWFYVISGKLAEDYTGPVDYDGSTFNVVNGMVR